MFNVSQNECEHELQEELGIEEGVQQMTVDDSCDDQVTKVRLSGFLLHCTVHSYLVNLHAVCTGMYMLLHITLIKPGAHVQR